MVSRLFFKDTTTMNAIIEEFISKKQKEQREKELKQREEHLISLGLLDPQESVERVTYFDVWDHTKDCKWDEEKQKYCKVTKQSAAIEVTDEEYQEILKYAPIISMNPEKADKHHAKTVWADTINTIAIVFLILNIIGGVILAISYGWIAVVVAVILCLHYPLIVGFSKVVAAAEKNLKE